MSHKQFNLLLAELRRSRAVCRYTAAQFNRWITNYLAPQLRFNGCCANAEDIIAAL